MERISDWLWNKVQCPTVLNVYSITGYAFYDFGLLKGVEHGDLFT